MQKKKNIMTYMSVAKAAERCGMSESFIRRAIYANQLKAKKFGRVVRIEKRVLSKWAESLPRA